MWLLLPQGCSLPLELYTCPLPHRHILAGYSVPRSSPRAVSRRRLRKQVRETGVGQRPRELAAMSSRGVAKRKGRWVSTSLPTCHPKHIPAQVPTAPGIPCASRGWAGARVRSPSSAISQLWQPVHFWVAESQRWHAHRENCPGRENDQ